MKPRTTTVILFFNKAQMTRRCLASVGRENVVLVNNGSTKETLQQLDQEHVLHIENNCGFSRGMNTGIRHAFQNGADRVVAVSNDIEVAGDFYSALSEIPLAPLPQILCPHVYFLKDKTKPAYTSGRVIGTKENMVLTHEWSTEEASISFPRYYPAAVTVWNRSAFETLGGFNEEFFCYWEDVELSLRAQRLQVDLLSCPGLRVFHFGRGTTGGKPQYNEHFAEGKRKLSLILGYDTHAPA